MKLRFNEEPAKLEQKIDPNIISSNLEVDTPSGFENWPKDKQREYLESGGNVEIPTETTEEEVSVSQIQRGLSSGSIALSATRKLEPYIGDRPNFRSESFSNLDQSQKDKIYLTLTSAINGAVKHLGWLKGKLITLVGESGISYENGEIKIGPDVSKEEILDYLEKISNDEKTSDAETVENSEQNLEEGFEKKDMQETEKHNSFKEGDVVSWNYDGNIGQGRIISFGIPDSDPKVIVDVGSDGTVEVSLDQLSVVYENELKEKEKNSLKPDKKEQESNEVKPLDYTPEFKEYLGKQDVNEGAGINEVSDENIKKQNIQNSIPPEGNLVEEQVEIKPVSNKEKIESGGLVKPSYENQNELNPKIPNSELTPENSLISNKDIIKTSNQVEAVGNEVVVGNRELEVFGDEKVVEGELILPQDLEKGSNVEKNNIIDTEASEVKDSQEKESQNTKEESEEFDIDKIIDISDIKKSEEWKNFERMREDVARSNALHLDASLTGLGVELNRSDYYGYKDVLSKKIKESILEKAGTNLSEDQKYLLSKKINEVTFNLLLKEENEAYNNALSEQRNESFIKNGKEGVGKLFSTKAFEWYKSQSMSKKILISTALFAPIATIGAFATGGGASVALGATAYRGARVGFGMAGAKLGSMVAGKGFEFGGNKLLWSEDEINKYEREKFTEIMDSEEDFETKSRRYDEVTQEVKKRRMDLIKAKAGLAVAGGVSAGIASGEAIEGILGTKTEAVFNNPELLNPTVESGDSVWKIIENTLEANERFKNLTEAQKTFIVGFYNNNVLDNPSDFGVREGGNILVGDKISLEKLFTNKNEFESFIDKVVKDIAPGSTREASILENNLKIKTWVKLNPDVRVTNEKVADILSGAPMKPMPNLDELDRSPMPETLEGSLEGSQVEEKIEPIETIRSEIPSKLEGLEESLEDQMFEGSEVREKIEPIETIRSEMPTELNENSQVETEVSSEKITSGSIEDISNKKLQKESLGTDIKTVEEGEQINDKDSLSSRGENQETTSDPYADTSIDKDKLREEIEKDKQRLEALENNKGPKISPNNMDLSAQIENAYLREMDQIYGKKRFMGLLGNISGVDTPEYKFISRLPAVKVVEYYSGDSAQAGFSAEISKELAESEQHRALWAQTDGLMKSVNGTVKPYQNENMGDYVRRLGGYVFKSHASKNI
jgi:hypothetical protein